LAFVPTLPRVRFFGPVPKRRNKMPRFVAIHNLGPGAREMFAQAGPAMLAAVKEVYPEVVWDGVHIEWETGKAVCVWDAPDAETVKGLFEQLQFPYEDLFPVERLSAYDLATGA
jgi:hypothetical protein